MASVGAWILQLVGSMVRASIGAIVRQYLFKIATCSSRLDCLSSRMRESKKKKQSSAGLTFDHVIMDPSKSNLSLYSLDYAEACNELAGPISASLRPGNTAPFEEMSQRWQAVGNTVSNLTGPRFEPQTSRSRDERVTARPTGRYRSFHY